MKLSPVKIWVQNVLPVVYDESLSYYETLSRLVKITNDVIEQTNANTDEIEKIKEVLDVIGNVDEFAELIEELKQILEELSPLSYYEYYYIDGINGSDDNEGLSIDKPLKTIDAAMKKVQTRDLRIRIITGETYETASQHFSNMSIHLVNYTQEYTGTFSETIVYFNADHAVQFYNCYTHFEGITLDWATDLYFDGGYAYHMNGVKFAKLTKFNGMNVYADTITYDKVAFQESIVKLHNFAITTTDANDNSIYLRDSKAIIYGGTFSHPVITNDDGHAIIYCVRGELTYALTIAPDAPVTGRTYGIYAQQTNLYATETRLSRIARVTNQGNSIQTNYPCIFYKGSTVLDLVDALNAKQNTLTFDSTPTSESTNPVTSGGIANALANKQNKLTFDSTPTASSTNPVTSDGIANALAGKLNMVEIGVVNSTKPVNITFGVNTRGFIVIYGGSSRQAMYLLNCNTGDKPVTNVILQSESNNFVLTPTNDDGISVLNISAVATNNCTIFLLTFTDPSGITHD